MFTRLTLPFTCPAAFIIIKLPPNKKKRTERQTGRVSRYVCLRKISRERRPLVEVGTTLYTQKQQHIFPFYYEECQVEIKFVIYQCCQPTQH